MSPFKKKQSTSVSPPYYVYRTWFVDPSMVLGGPSGHGGAFAAIRNGTVDLWWLNRALLNLADDPKNWRRQGGVLVRDPRRVLSGFQTLISLPLAGGVGAAHASEGILPEMRAKMLLTYEASHLYKYANMLPDL